MAVESQQLAVSTSAVQVATGNAQVGDDVKVYMHNAGTNTVYLGGPSVTSTTGRQLGNGVALEVTLSSGDDLYAICAAAESATLHILRTRQPS